MLPIATNSEAQSEGLPFNARTGNAYSGANVIRLASEPFSDPRWAGFNQWLEVGRCVRKGEHGTRIMMILSVKGDESKAQSEGPGTESKGRGSTARVVPVFNFEQTEEISSEEAHKILAAKAERRAKKSK